MSWEAWFVVFALGAVSGLWIWYASQPTGRHIRDYNNERGDQQ